MTPPFLSWRSERRRGDLCSASRPVRSPRPCRRTVAVTLIALTACASARAQNAPIQATPLPPLQEQSQPAETPPGVPLPGPDSNAQSQAPSAPSAAWPNVWVPAGMVKLQALDKVNALASQLTIKVGESATFGSLTIAVKSCMLRPPDQPADAAAYLDVTDSHADSPGFDGWMLANEPSVSMMQHPIYDLRVTGCG
jgi:hypothetical protein